VIAARQAEIAEGGAAVPRRSWPNERQLAALALFAIAAVAIALRLIPIVVVPSVDWPDEIFRFSNAYADIVRCFPRALEASLTDD